MATDILIVCALEEEFKAVISEFSGRCEGFHFEEAFNTDIGCNYQCATMKDKTGELLTVLVICMARKGPIETAISVSSIINEFRPRFIALTGICAGYKENVALGDIVVAECAFHYEEGKIGTDENGGPVFWPEYKTYNVSNRVLQCVNSFTTWLSPVVEIKQHKLGRELREGEQSQRFIAPVASGMVVQGNNPFPDLLKQNRKAWFLDQEVAAFYETLHSYLCLFSRLHNYHIFADGIK